MANKIQVRRGAIADLPTLSSGEPGLALDTRQLFFGTDTTNLEIATAAQLADKSKKFWFDVTDSAYGADSSGDTNSTTAIQTAINACGSAGGGVVYFPPGSYLSGYVVVKYSYVYLKGAGVGATKLTMAPGNNNALIQLGDYNDLAVRGTLHHMGVSDMEIDGNKTNQAQGSGTEDGTGIGIRTEDVRHISIRRIGVHDCDGYGLGIVGSHLPNREDLFIEDVETYNNAYDGIDIKEGFLRVSINNLYSHGNGGGAIIARDAVGMDIRGEHVRVTNCIAEGNEDHGFRVRTDTDEGSLGAGDYIELSNCQSYDNDLDGFSIDGVSTGEYVLTACYAVGNRNGFTKLSGKLVLNSCVSKENTVDGVYFRPTTDGSDGILEIVGGSISENTQDGVSASSTPGQINIIGAIIKANGRRGVDSGGATRLYASGSIIEGNGTANRDNGVGILLSSQTSYFNINNCQINDDHTVSGDKFQKYAIQFSGTNTSAGLIKNNDLSGNWTTEIQSTIPAGTIVADNGSYLTGSATLDPTSLADGDGVTLTITVTGAVLGDYCQIAAPYALQGLTVTSWVNQSNIVAIRIQNVTGGTIDLASGTWKARISKG